MGFKRVVVVGAGAVGIGCALWLQRDGHQVTLIDPDDPASGTTSGNACTFADYGCIPVNNPGLMSRLPGLLLNPDSPLRVDPLHAISHMGWMLQFLRHCTRREVDKTISGLGVLLRETAAGIDPLIAQTDSEHLLQRNGCLYVYESEQSFQNEWQDNLRRQAQGVEFEVVDSARIRALEPNLRKDFKKGLLFADARQTVNPLTLFARFARSFETNGGKLVRGRVSAINDLATAAVLDDGKEIEADRFVIAAGAFSTRIRGTGAEHLPLGTERGYHVQFAGEQTRINRPVGWAEAGFYAVPMNEGLRLAGTVEIAGLDKPPNQRRLAYMTRKAHELFELKQAPDQTWLGFRPTMPDSLPVIDRARNGRVIYAFGHHHLGVTLSGITGRLVAEMVGERPPSIDLTPYASGRFD